MDRIKTWWNGLSGRGKVITVVAIVVALGIIGAINSEDQPETASASQTAEATANDDPTEDPTATPEPTATSDPTSEPTPTPEPTPTQEPTPTPEPEPAFAAIELSGTGDSIPRFEIPEGSAAIADVTHTGAANFAVFTLSADGEQTDLLVNTIGNYSGTVLFDEQTGQHSVAFDVTAGGAWTMTIKPVTTARAWDGSSELAGSGDDVVRVDPPTSGLVTATVSHTGASNFAVIGYNTGLFGQDLMVNEIGNYSGEVAFEDGTYLLEITADGSWSITPS